MGFLLPQKMSKAEILAFIQSLYPGQVVLYSDQLARLIGKTEKALSELINRGTLPFKPKLLGGRRCVDIFTVAEWLHTDGLREGAIPEAPSLKSTEKTTGAKPRKSIPSDGSRKSLAGDLMRMRYEAANAISRFAPNAADEIERGFLLELVEELTQGCFSTDESLGSAWLVKLSTATGCSGEVTRTGSLDDALALVERFKVEVVADGASVALLHGGQCVYLACRIDENGWTTLIDEIPDFPEDGN